MTYSTFILFFLYFSGIVFTAIIQKNNCDTINTKPGRCIKLEDCPSLFSLSEQKPLSVDNELHIALSQCGDDGSSVCCDVNDDELLFADTTPSQVTLSVRSDPDSNFISCNTPEGKKGQCITIESCPSLLKLLRFRPFLPENQDLLRRAGCGFEGIKAKVCCSLEFQTKVEPRFPTEDEYIPEGPTTSDLLPDISNCGITGSDKIIGGEVAGLYEFPWMARLEYETPHGNTFDCGGSLINSRYVLTAAHCIKRKGVTANWKLVSVRLGEYDTTKQTDCVIDPYVNDTFCSDPPVNVPVVEQIIHEFYVFNSSLNRSNDIGLLRLGREVAITDFVKPICLPTLDLLNNRYTGINMTVAGWGATGNSSASNILLKLQLTVQSFSDCSFFYGSRIKLGAGQICAGGNKDRDACTGDSGGPLMLIDVKSGPNYYVAGIVSFGPAPCGIERWPSVYTKTTYYLPWIVSNLKP